MKKSVLLAAIAIAFSSAAFAQSNPGLTKGQVLTAGQWNALFAGKQDVLGFTPMNAAGGTFSGRVVTPAPGASRSGLNLIPGTTPGSPVDGDIWFTSSGFFARVNGTTIGPISGASASSFAAIAPVTVSFPSSVVTYACPTCATSTLNTAALTAVNDTNVTITLGGNPTMALLNAASITLAWSGQLDVSRGGTGAATLTANSVVLGQGTGAVGFATIGTAGRLLIDKGAGADPAFTSCGGDCTSISGVGAFTMGKVNGVSFPASPSTDTVPVVTSANTITYEAVPNAALANSTISGVALGSNLFALTFGTHLTAGDSSYNGSSAVTITSDATNANTASTIVARDVSGNFSAGTITASLTGHSSLDLALTGGTMSGAIAMGANDITGVANIAATTINGNTFTTGTGTLTIAAGKTLTDTSGVGASILLGATGGGFSAYAGATCTNQALTVLSAAGAATCASITNAFLTAGTFGSITGVGTLTAGATGTGFTVALGTSTISGLLTGTNGGTGVNNGSNTITVAGNLSTAAALTHAGAFATTITATAITNSTLPAGTHMLAGLDVAQTWSALQGFNDNAFGLNGSTSGNLVLRAAATSGSSVIRFPNGSTDFSATGGAAQYLKQTSSGGAITVGAITKPTYQSFCTSGCTSSSTSGTYTTAAGATWIKITLIGGGGGSGGTGVAGGDGGNGGDTCWNTSGAACTTPVYQAGGGVGAVASSNGPLGGTVSGSGTCDVAVAGQAGQGGSAAVVVAGAQGGSSPFGMGMGGAGAAAGGSPQPPTGFGGGGGGGNFVAGGVATGAGGGGAGCFKIINGPDATYTFAFGAAGAAGAAGTGGGAAGQAGTAGGVWIEEHYD